jgi:hypothetical protein
MFRKEDFDARAGGLRGLDEDEFVFVGQDHRDSAGNLLMRTVFGKLPKTPKTFGGDKDRATVLLRSLREYSEGPTASQPVKHSIDLCF